MLCEDSSETSNAPLQKLHCSISSSTAFGASVALPGDLSGSAPSCFSSENGVGPFEDRGGPLFGKQSRRALARTPFNSLHHSPRAQRVSVLHPPSRQRQPVAWRPTSPATVRPPDIKSTHLRGRIARAGFGDAQAGFWYIISAESNFVERGFHMLRCNDRTAPEVVHIVSARLYLSSRAAEGTAFQLSAAARHLPRAQDSVSQPGDPGRRLGAGHGSCPHGPWDRAYHFQFSHDSGLVRASGWKALACQNNSCEAPSKALAHEYGTQH